MRARTSILVVCWVALACSCTFDRSGVSWSDPDVDGGVGADGGGADADPDSDAGCIDACAVGSPVRCSADRRTVEACATGAAGCTAWVAEELCSFDDHCVDATAGDPARCALCAACSEGEATCAVGESSLREVCVSSGDGCTMWEEVDCGTGALCEVPSAGEPAVCESCVECTALDPVCGGSGVAVERCELEPNTGCRDWVSFDCPGGWSCAPGMTAELCSQDGTAGLSGVGTTGYPTRPFGNTATGSGPVLGNYLVGDRYTLAAPLTALELRTYGTDGGSIKISIYDHDAANDLPGNKLFPEVTSALASNAWTTIALPTRFYLPAGTYWIVFNATADDGVTYSTQTGGARVWKAMSYSGTLPGTGGAGWTRSTAMDCTHVVGVAVRGYAKATRITLSDANVEADAMHFYAHEAGSFRVSIYDDNTGPGSRLWESASTAAAAASWTAVPMSAGTPTSLTLSAGTYWLVWQWDSVSAGPGYAAGGGGDGHWSQLPYGPFPATWPGGVVSTETWSLYLSYTAHIPPIGW